MRGFTVHSAGVCPGSRGTRRSVRSPRARHRCPPAPGRRPDPPGPPLAHPPLVLCLLVVVLVVAVVPPPSSSRDHSPGLARGVVGAVFCAGAGQTGTVTSQRARSPSQEVWRWQPDTSQVPILLAPPTLLATAGRGPQDGHQEGPGGQESCTCSPGAGEPGAQKAEGSGPGPGSKKSEWGDGR